MKASKLTSEINDWSDDPIVKINSSRIAIHKGMVSLLWGKSYSGKTALSMYISKQALSNNENVLYWDTEGGLRKHDQNTEHVSALKKESQDGGELVLSQDIPDEDNYKQKIDEMEEVIKSEDISLAVIDSIIFPVIDMDPRTRSSLFKTIFRKFSRIASQNNTALLITTHVSTTNMNKIDKKGLNKTIDRPIGGNSMLHMSDTQLYIDDLGKAKDQNDDRKRVLYSIEDEISEKFQICRSEQILQLGDNVGGAVE
jgi:RecA/RadA recombinase